MVYSTFAVKPHSLHHSVNIIDPSFVEIFGGAIAISAFLNLFLPGAFKVRYSLVIIVRILQGLAEVGEPIQLFLVELGW